ERGRSQGRQNDLAAPRAAPAKERTTASRSNSTALRTYLIGKQPPFSQSKNRTKPKEQKANHNRENSHTAFSQKGK
ncbi:MAG TPA: hypothetical protein V6C97_11080, partial [Oculatellaceae cyanobacterium]